MLIMLLTSWHLFVAQIKVVRPIIQILLINYDKATQTISRDPM